MGNRISKPDTMSVKEYVLKNTSEELQIPLSIVKTVIDHQFTTALEALKTQDSLEIAGLGKFFFYKKKALHKINDYKRMIADAEEKIKKNEIPDDELVSFQKNIISMTKYRDSIVKRIEDSDKEAFTTKAEVISNKKKIKYEHK